MIELKKLNVHRIVDSEEAAARLETDGFSVVNQTSAESDDVPIEDAPPAKPAKAK